MWIIFIFRLKEAKYIIYMKCSRTRLWPTVKETTGYKNCSGTVSGHCNHYFRVYHIWGAQLNYSFIIYLNGIICSISMLFTNCRIHSILLILGVPVCTLEHTDGIMLLLVMIEAVIVCCSWLLLQSLCRVSQLYIIIPGILL